MQARRGIALLRSLGLALCVTVAGAGAGCSGPYAGKPEALKRPSKKPEPDVPPPSAMEIKMVEECPAKFQEEPKDAQKQHNRNKSAATRAVEQADSLLDSARTNPDDKAKASQTTEAINKLRKALLDAPYHADATYKLAHAYAITRRKGCAIALLKRLLELKGHPEFEADALRKINEAESDPVFAPFRKQANEAINR